MSGHRLRLAPPRPARDDEVAAVLDCLRSGWLTMGPRTQGFEAALAAWTGASHAVAVASGTAALHLACLAAGLGEGDEVIVPAFAPESVAAAVRWCGAVPVPCDVVGPLVPNLDVAAVEPLLTERTRAVLAVHLWGQPADVILLRELCDQHGLLLLEDATCALGATAGAHARQAGTVGDLGAFCFADGRQVSVGEGGMVVCASAEHAARVRSLRGHALTSGTWDRHRGHAAGYDVVDIGFNYRMDEARAALGAARLDGLREELEARRQVARRYRAGLGEAGIALPWNGEDVARAAHGAFGVLLADSAERDAAARRLDEAGVETAVTPSLGDLPHARDVAARHLLLPIAGMGIAEADAVVAALG